MTIELNDGQGAALREILEARDDGRPRHLLTGYAGTGKTTLMQAVVRELKALKLAVAVTAPTHKAVQVLASKLGEGWAGRCPHHDNSQPAWAQAGGGRR